jgi:hypothetical protein
VGRRHGRLADLHSDGGREDRHVQFAPTTLLLMLTISPSSRLHIEGE